jgi:hypothetical protein
VDQDCERSACADTDFRDYSAVGLKVKRDEANVLLPDCSYSCGLDTCGGGSCANTKKKRLFEPAQYPAQYAANSSRSLQKRVFTSPPGRITKITSIRGYVPQVLEDVGYDPQFRGNFGDVTAATNMATGSQQAPFGNVPLQWGARFIHGCTMFAITSKRGAYFVSSRCGFQFWMRVSTPDAFLISR